MVRHTCDVRLCVRPDHLLLGTQADNMRDMAERDRCQRGDTHWMRTTPERIPRGEARAQTRLTVEAVIAMRARRAAGASCPLLATEYGVSAGTVWAAVMRKTWRHVPDAPG